ncbi:putative aspartate aminotransferase, cytoplasmic 2 isoform X2 [Talpa occidentalis]|uniref:putative aspartate aminotransferase, cytoplasmic 2 isoform X2 n=1 Tax=Talpa occidentalis TaxID=50954 RepID=UPI0018906F84|nr:putative aspartate aminotransferase, cytoplasmic 2 isoform X2 [Talpa occidentalis]
MTTLSVFLDVPLARKLEGSLLKIYKQDDHTNKMFLAYKVCMNNEGEPWISSVVAKIRLQISRDPSLDYEYIPEMGMESFIQSSVELLFGKHSQAIMENRVGGLHTVGESGAFQVGAKFLKTWCQDSQTVYIISSHKEHHGLIFQDMGFRVYEHSFWNSKQLCVDPDMLLDVAENKQIFPFFDIPWQGFLTGDVEEDTRFLQYFVCRGFEFFCSQFLSKSFGIYDEGVGILVVVTLNNQLLLCVLSQLRAIARALWLTPPTMGARIITSILSNPALHGEWKQSLKVVVENIMLIKEKVKEKLRLLGTPGSWEHITNQIGTHSYLGLNFPQLEYLVKKKHIYIPKSGRINFTCINASNIDYITESINEAVLCAKEVNDL